MVANNMSHGPIRRGKRQLFPYRFWWVLLVLVFGSCLFMNIMEALEKDRSTTHEEETQTGPPRGGKPSRSVALLRANHKDNSEPQQPFTKKCVAATEHLVKLGINVVALDFDSTLVDIHTKGHWDSTPEALAEHIRPEMRCLIEMSIYHGIQVAVASFSNQRQVIESTIVGAIPSVNHDNIVVRGGRNVSEKTGKRKQLKDVMERLEASSSGGGLNDLSPSRVILIDDDNRNVDIALKDGFWALLFDPDGDSDHLFTSIISLRQQ